MNNLVTPKGILGCFIAFVVFILAVSFWPVTSVPTGFRGVITVGGHISGIQEEGFLFIAPWQKKVDFNIRAEQADVEKAEGSTADQQPVVVSLTVRYSIALDRVAEVYEKYSHDGNLASYVQTATQETVKAVSAKYTAPELIAKRANVSNDISIMLKDKMRVFGAQIISIDMRNFSFSPTYMAAINEKVTQEQLKLGAENKFLTVQAEQKQKVAIAEAEASAQRATADGQAYAQLKIATAQADALRIQSAALAQNKDVLELRKIEVAMAQAKAWDGKLPVNMYSAAPVPFLNLTSK